MTADSGARSTWEEHKGNIIVVAVVVALIAALVAVRVAIGGGGEDPGPASVAIDDAAGADAGAVDADAGGPGTDTADEASTEDGSQTSGEQGDTSDGATGPGASNSDPGSGDAGGDGAASSGSSEAPAGEPKDEDARAQERQEYVDEVSGTPLPGVTDTEIRIAYYWRGDDTRTSQFMSGAGQSGNVDEGDAFRKFVEYVNANGSGEYMGFPFDLHGRKIVGQVFEAGRNADTFAATLEEVKEFAPMAAFSPTGSMSDFFCPQLAALGIHNFATYDLRGDLAATTNGYCTPAGMGFERQVELSGAWLLRQQRASDYSGPEGLPGERVYGILYAEYDGLVNGAGQAMVDHMASIGLNVAATATVSSSLADSQQQMGSVIQKFRSAGVNTVVMPDGGAPLSFTHAAQANAYNPDYFVWPCSGQDTVGFVRLLNAIQWTRASGLSCYDEAYHSDIALNDRMRDAQWYDQYKSVAPNDTPPAQSPFVYSGFLPILVGVTNAGPDLSLESFRAGIQQYRPQRYDFIEGPTTDPTRIMVDIGAPSGTIVADAITVVWNGSKQIPGAAHRGDYDYPEDRRYRYAREFR